MPIYAVDDTAFIEYTPQYNILEIFDNGISAVRAETEYILINANNKVKNHINGEILGYSDHVTRIYRNNRVIFLNDAGIEFLTIDGIYAKQVIGGKVAVQDESFMYGMYNDKGEMLLSHDYINILYGTGSHVLLQSDTGWIEYDIIQNYVVEEYDEVYSSDDEYVICSVDEKIGVINFDGELLLPFQFDKIGVSSDTFIAYSSDTTSCYDMKGNVLYSNMNGICGTYSEGMFYNNEDDAHTYKSSSGRVMFNLSDITEMQFGHPFYDGYAVIQASGKKTYINTSGTQLTEQMWDDAYRFSNGYALVMNRLGDSDAGTYYNQWYIIDENFEIVKTLDYDVYVDASYPASTDFSDGYIRTIDRETGLMGFIRLDEFNFENTNDKLSIIGRINSYGSESDPVTIQLIDDDDNVADTITTTSGSYEFEAASGVYTIRVSKTKHCTREYTVIISGSDVEQDVEIWLYGDVTGDGKVNMIDVGQIKRKYNGLSSVFNNADSYTENYRLSVANVYAEDNIVNMTDVGQVKRYYNGLSSVFDRIP